MAEVTAEKKDITKSTITVHWNKVEGEAAGGKNVVAEKYQVAWRTCGSADWPAANQADTTELEYTLENVDNASCWEFKVRAVNAICPEANSPWSKTPNAEFTSGAPPGQLDSPTIDIVQDLRGIGGGEPNSETNWKVKIEWAAPPADDMVKDYSIFILNGEGEFLEDKTICDGSNSVSIQDRSCSMPMSTFWKGEFALDQGTYITAKVRANNAKGEGAMSRWNTSGAVVEKLPAMMNPPTGPATGSLRDSSTNSINLAWTALTSPRDGGSHILTYEL